MLGTGFHTLIKVFVLLLNRHGISQSTLLLLRGQRPYWISFLSPIDVGPHQIRRGFHTLIKIFALLLNRCAISQSTPFRGQRPRRTSFLFSIDVGPHQIRRGFHTLIKVVSFSPTTDLGSHKAYKGFHFLSNFSPLHLTVQNTTLHNDMLLFTLSISSRLTSMERVFFVYKPMIIP